MIPTGISNKWFMSIIPNPIDTDSFIYIGDRRRRLVIIVIIGVVRVITVREKRTVMVRTTTPAAVIITNPVISVGVGQSVSRVCED